MVQQITFYNKRQERMQNLQTNNRDKQQKGQNQPLEESCNSKALPRAPMNYEPDDSIQDPSKQQNVERKITRNEKSLQNPTQNQTRIKDNRLHLPPTPQRLQLKVVQDNKKQQQSKKQEQSKKLKQRYQKQRNGRTHHTDKNTQKEKSMQKQSEPNNVSGDKLIKISKQSKTENKSDYPRSQSCDPSDDTINPSKRTRDNQNDDGTPGSMKKRYEFCQKSIIFNIDPQYDLEKLIGSGIYGIVASGRNRQNNQPVAIKKISKLFNNFGDTRRVLRQIKVLQFLNHKNIIALQAIMTIQNLSTFNQIYLVMEYMEFDLRRLIQSQMKITQQMIKFIMYQLLVAINFMHSADILHRDLKPENILMNKKCQLKLADMNLARKQTYTGKITDYVASRPYRAPQILIGSTVYTKSVDIWSIGCIFAELLGKTIIFHGKDYIDQLKRFVAILGKPKIEYFPNIDKTSMQSLTKLISQIPDKQKVQWRYLMPNISDKAADLLDHMLTYDSRARYTAQECLNHPYLDQYKRAPRMKCKEVFDFSFDRIELRQATLREAIFNAVRQFNAKKKTRMEQKAFISPQGDDKMIKKIKTQ